MNRRLIIALTTLAALLAGGAAYLARRRPAAPPQETEAVPFQSQEAGAAILLRHADDSSPLRALRWLPPGPGGRHAVQIVTQTDRQRVALFENGSFAGLWLIPRPEGVGEGFFRLAELDTALAAGPDLLVLLYQAAAGTRGEPSLLLALDRRDGSVRWTRRTPGRSLILQPGTDGPTALWCYGPETPPQRVDLRTGKVDAPLELPQEVQAPGQVLATRNGSLILAHGQGLALRKRTGVWTHLALPGSDTAQPPTGAPGALASGPTGSWWQPRPDQIVAVAADGSLGEPIPLTLPEPWDRDVPHLHLLGVAPDGGLWFDLAASSGSTFAPQDSGWEDSGAPSPETAAAALAPDVPRVYRFDPLHRRFDQCRLDRAWKALQAPVAAPESFAGLTPAGGAWVHPQADGSLLWIPLTRLPLAAVEAQPR